MTKVMNISVNASQSPQAKWVEEMHTHRSQQGFYRPADVQRVLGDIRRSVSVTSSDVQSTVVRPSSASKLPKK